MLKFTYIHLGKTGLSYHKVRTSHGNQRIRFNYICICTYIHICDLIKQYVVALSDIPHFYTLE